MSLPFSFSRRAVPREAGEAVSRWGLAGTVAAMNGHTGLPALVALRDIDRILAALMTAPLDLPSFTRTRWIDERSLMNLADFFISIGLLKQDTNGVCVKDEQWASLAFFLGTPRNTDVPVGSGRGGNPVSVKTYYPLAGAYQTVRAVNRSEPMARMLLGAVVVPALVALHQLAASDGFGKGEAIALQHSSVEATVFANLVSILAEAGIVELANNRRSFCFTEYGWAMWELRTAHFVPFTYYQFQESDKLRQFIKTGKITGARCDRVLNVEGTGATHGKLFDGLLAHVRSTGATYLADIGCGDGKFLKQVQALRPDLKLIGFDFEAEPLAITQREVEGSRVFTGNSARPAEIATTLRRAGINQSQVFFTSNGVLHEVTGWRDGHSAENLFKAYYRHLRHSQGLAAWEVLAIDPRDAATHGRLTTNVAYKLVHDLSGQGMLTEREWRKAATASGFRVTWNGIRPVGGSSAYGFLQLMPTAR